jgi:hypothetical protein
MKGAGKLRPYFVVSSGTSGLSLARAAVNDGPGSALRVCSSQRRPS